MNEIHINTGFKDHVSPENVHVLLWYYVVNVDEAPSFCSQIAEQIEVIKEEVLKEVIKSI